jgi:hypothetical protein
MATYTHDKAFGCCVVNGSEHNEVHNAEQEQSMKGSNSHEKLNLTLLTPKKALTSVSDHCDPEVWRHAYDTA